MHQLAADLLGIGRVDFKMGIITMSMINILKTKLGNKLNGPGRAKKCLVSYAICEQQRPSLVSTFVVHCLDSMICILAISKVSKF